MKLALLDNMRKNIFHLLHTFKNDNEGMPLHHTRLVAQSFKNDPLIINCMTVETSTIICLNNTNYNFDTRLAIDMYTLAEAEENANWRISQTHKLIEDEMLDVAIGLQRCLLKRMVELNLLTADQTHAFNNWNCITPSGLLTELETDSIDFNPIQSAYSVANSVNIELTTFFKDRIK